jgi:hypothetical protein
MKHKLDLRGNALDSLDEGLRRYLDGREGDVRAYKFAVLHFAHFIELLMKDAVAKQHPLLIYDKPTSQPIEKANTINVWSAILILENAGFVIDKGLRSDLEWLKKLRNSIEHLSFDMDVKEVRSTLGRLLRAAADFIETTGLPPLATEIARDCTPVFNELLDEYLEKLANARADARREAGEGDPTYCTMCGEQDVAYLEDGAIVCAMCDERERIRHCFNCEQPYRESEVSVWNDEHEVTDYVCEFCEERIFRDR